tara:strand:+ start:6070 stop:6774 length:705 start_codon:yes stop_codon:yes gene_type:complete
MNCYNIFNKFSGDIELILPIITIPSLDILLCCMISNKARWFQLHAIINLIIVYIIFEDVKIYFNELFNGIIEKTSNLDNYFILVLHLYHCLFFNNLSVLDYFHHLLFIITGVIPCTHLFKTNISRLISFTGCGLPGIIEYGSLVLMKHDIITPLTQKNINSYMYVYLRTPLSIFNVSFIFIAYKEGYFYQENQIILFYIIFLTYFNGTFYNKLTIENYRNSYYKKILINKNYNI